MVKVSRRTARFVLASAVALMVGGACTDTDSATNLYTIGPPMISQVFMEETFVDQFGATDVQRVFGFGTNVAAMPAIVHPVTSASAIPAKGLRVIMDHLLRGNRLEAIACRGIIDTSDFSTVPDNATPDDIAACSVPQDVLPSTCVGENAVCICNIPTGCSAGGTIVPMGQSVGVLDDNEDGAADDTRFIDGAVGIQCGTTMVPIDLDASFWDPSGDQQEPAAGGFDALGPAIVVAPKGAMPTNQTCGLVFDPSIVDKSNLQVCAPPDGDVLQGCTPPDVSAFSFKVQPLTLSVQGITDGDMQISRTDNISAVTNVPIDPASVSSITFTEGPTNTPVPMIMITVTSTTTNSVITIHSTAATGLDASTMFTLTFPGTATGIRDIFESPLPSPVVVHFTTGA